MIRALMLEGPNRGDWIAAEGSAYLATIYEPHGPDANPCSHARFTAYDAAPIGGVWFWIPRAVLNPYAWVMAQIGGDPEAPLADRLAAGLAPFVAPAPAPAPAAAA